MLRTFCAHTNEIDDVEEAVADILTQLDLGRLLRHSAALMYYHGDFSETGVVKRLCEELPFPVIGGTTSNSAVQGSEESMVLTIMIFTSDDCYFSAGISASLKEEVFTPLEELYRRLMEEKPLGMDKPAMFFIIPPCLAKNTGDDYLAAFNGLGGGIPVFGSAAFTHTADFSNIKTCFNGVEYDDALPVMAFWGPLEPKFFLSTIPEEQILNHRAVITDSYRNRIKTVNGVPVMQYMESIGLAKDGTLPGIASFPLILHLPGGSRVIRDIAAVEENELLCSGLVPPLALMEISFCDRDFVMRSAHKTASECYTWLEAEEKAGRSRIALVVSCAARRWTLGSDVYGEIRVISGAFKNSPFHFAYSRGEFCPVQGMNGKEINFFFNYSLCMCVL